MFRISTALAAQLAAVCPKAPPGAQGYMNDVTGYVQWGVLAILGIGGIIAVGAIAGGRMFNMPHASKMGMLSGVVIFCAAIIYMIFPSMIHGVTGNGCL